MECFAYEEALIGPAIRARKLLEYPPRTFPCRVRLPISPRLIYRQPSFANSQPTVDLPMPCFPTRKSTRLGGVAPTTNGHQGAFRPWESYPHQRFPQQPSPARKRQLADIHGMASEQRHEPVDVQSFVPMVNYGENGHWLKSPPKNPRPAKFGRCASASAQASNNFPQPKLARGWERMRSLKISMI